jgi:HEAT repeat protein
MIKVHRPYGPIENAVRIAVVDALVKIGSPAVKPLISSLKEKDPMVRDPVVWILGKIGDKRAVEPLIQILKDENQYVREGAARALKRITGQDFGEDAEKWQKWWEESAGKKKWWQFWK